MESSVATSKATESRVAVEGYMKALGEADVESGRRRSWCLGHGASADETELVVHVRSPIAHFKAPRAVVFGPELPKTSTGSQDGRRR